MGFGCFVDKLFKIPAFVLTQSSASNIKYFPLKVQAGLGDI